jgi:hypothetical protein
MGFADSCVDFWQQGKLVQFDRAWKKESLNS